MSALSNCPRSTLNSTTCRSTVTSNSFTNYTVHPRIFIFWMLFIIVATVGCFTLPISTRHLFGWFCQWWIQTFDQGSHHEADPDIWLGQGNLICFPCSISRLFLCWRGA